MLPRCVRTIPGDSVRYCSALLSVSLRTPADLRITSPSMRCLTASIWAIPARARHRLLAHPLAPRSCAPCLSVAPSRLHLGTPPPRAACPCLASRMPLRHARHHSFAQHPRASCAQAPAFLPRTRLNHQHPRPLHLPWRERSRRPRRVFSRARTLPGAPSQRPSEPRPPDRRARGMRIWFLGAVILSLGP